ncbi:MAG TPA: glycosyltransferase family 4 protein [bacterium]
MSGANASVLTATERGPARRAPRLLLVAPYFPPKRGGVENYAGNVSRGLAGRGWEVTVATTRHEGGPDEVVRAEGVTVHRLGRLVRVSNTPLHPGWWWRLRQIAAAAGPDVINAHLPVPFLADLAVRRAAGVPTVVTYHNDIVKDAPAARAAARCYQVALLRGTLARASRIVATSERYAALSPHLRPHARKIVVIAPGVDLTRFHPAAPPDGLRERYAGREVVVFAGQLDRTHRHKGVEVLLQAMALLRVARPQALCLVLGGGDGEGEYRRRAVQLGARDHVEFTGEVADELLPGYLRLAAAVVLPSLNQCEGFGMVLLEAAACGTPAVASAVGGVPAAVEHGHTGLLLPPGDSPALARALEVLLAAPAAARRMGEAARARAAGYAWSRQVERHDRLFRELCGWCGDPAA